MKKYKYTKTFTYEGKRYYIRGDTLQQCYEKWGRRLAELEAGTKQITKQMRFDDWAKEWLKVYKEPTVARETYMSYKSCIECYIFPLIGSMSLKSIRSIHCQRVINEMSGLAHATTKKVAMLLYAIFDAAIDNDLLIENPARKLNIPKGRKDTRRTITPTERTYILKTAETHRGGLWVLLQLYCGLRPSEAAGLRWMDVNINEKTLTVNQAIKRYGSVGPPKTEAGIRKIPIPDALLSKLHPGDPFDYVCTNTKGDRLKASAMRDMWLSFRNQLNIEMGCNVSPKGEALPPFRVADDLVPYCLRHTYCTDLRDAGVDITVAKVLMGHSSIAMTASIYTHQTDEAFQDAADKINRQGATQGATI